MKTELYRARSAEVFRFHGTADDVFTVYEGSALDQPCYACGQKHDLAAVREDFRIKGMALSGTPCFPCPGDYIVIGWSVGGDPYFSFTLTNYRPDHFKKFFEPAEPQE